jgi:hypothetical protein
MALQAPRDGIQTKTEYWLYAVTAAGSIVNGDGFAGGEIFIRGQRVTLGTQTRTARVCILIKNTVTSSMRFVLGLPPKLDDFGWGAYRRANSSFVDRWLHDCIDLRMDLGGRGSFCCRCRALSGQ